MPVQAQADNGWSNPSAGINLAVLSIFKISETLTVQANPGIFATRDIKS
jgi:hypothetical protein